jgi:hypothetical protein
MSKKSKRKIHLFGKVWEYIIGNGRIVIWSPDGKKYLTDMSEVSGWSWTDIERGTWKGYFSITPQMIKDHIEYKIL